VQPGEGLTTIATKQGVPDTQKDAWINELLRLNSIAEARLVLAGQALRLPPAPVFITQPIPQPQLVVAPSVVAGNPPQPPATAATPTKTPVPAVIATVSAVTLATATPAAKAPIAGITTAATKTAAIPAKTPAIVTPALIATPTTVKPPIVLPSSTPAKQVLPTATTTPYAGSGGGPTLCNDSWVSPSSGSGTCSSHGGIKK
jgi:hypothetical protein